jgi:pyruvate ferredoxin oxidoreductase alpha subunit
MQTILEGSRAIAQTVRNCQPDVVSAYPITPQTHIVEDLAKFKSDGASYEYIRAESEFAAASVVAGASATGVRVYTSTSSQGLLLMTEIIFNIAGSRLPVVMTCANRAVSGPINIWNDQQDSITVRDAGWIMLYAETNQEAVDLHIQAYKIAETTMIPVMINIDGFVLTHTFEPIDIISPKEIEKFIGKYRPKAGTYLDPKNPISIGCFVSPNAYLEIREQLHQDVLTSKKVIVDTAKKFNQTFRRCNQIDLSCQNGLFEEYQTAGAQTILITMGSLAGTMKDAIDQHNEKNKAKVGLIKIRCFRPFPEAELVKALSKAKYIGVVEKCVSLGRGGILAGEVKSMGYGKLKAKISEFIVGLGGRDITVNTILSIIKNSSSAKYNSNKFVK